MCIRDRGDPGLRDPLEDLGGRGRRTRQGEDRPLAGPDDIGVAPVGHRVGGVDEVDPGRVRGAQHGTEVAGLLDTLGDEDQRRLRGLYEGQPGPGGGDDGEDAVGAVPVGDLLEGGSACLLYTSRCV